MNKGVQRTKAGFTLAEMVVGTSISLVLMLVVMSSFLNNRKTYERMELEQEMQQQVRTAIKFLQRDLRLCGSGLVMSEAQLPEWFPALSGVRLLPDISTDANGNEVLKLAGYTGAPVGTLRNAVSAGATSLEVVLNPNLDVPYVPRVGDVLVLGSVEPIRVNGVSGNVLTFSTDPTVSGQGTTLAYPAGFDVYELATVTYRLETWNGNIGLIREDSRYTYSQNADKFVSLHIEAFRAQRTGGEVSVEIAGKTSKPMAGYKEQVDEYPRFRITVDQQKRNTSPWLSTRFWDSNVLMPAVPTATPPPGPTATPAPTPVPTVRPHDYSGPKQDCWCWGTPDKFSH